MSGIHPFRVLRAKPLWIANGVITGVLALLFTVFYVGANIDPVDHMKNLPVGLVNADKGPLSAASRSTWGLGSPSRSRSPPRAGARSTGR
uniref:DUF3533 domain-containing protein n=1 Tax=Streptomyces avermitilis TaxID=33903 RepID=A0A499V242_STRAX|nr:hypothetical protein SAVMC3_01710 [Streptomyces avermitilis]